MKACACGMFRRTTLLLCLILDSPKNYKTRVEVLHFIPKELNPLNHWKERYEVDPRYLIHHPRSLCIRFTWSKALDRWHLPSRRCRLQVHSLWDRVAGGHLLSAVDMHWFHWTRLYFSCKFIDSQFFTLTAPYTVIDVRTASVIASPWWAYLPTFSQYYSDIFRRYTCININLAIVTEASVFGIRILWNLLLCMPM